MVRARGYRKLREIDVLVESDGDAWHMKIAVEAKDYRRKIDVTEMEKIIGKYRSKGGLVVDRVVFICRNGFSRTAKVRAKQNGIETFTLSEATEADWNVVLPGGITSQSRLEFNLNFEIAPHVSNVNLVLADKRELSKAEVARCQLVHSLNRCFPYSPIQCATQLLNQKLLPTPEFKSELGRLLQSQQSVRIQVMSPMVDVTVSLDDRQWELKTLTFDVCATRLLSPVKLTPYALKGDDGIVRVIPYGLVETDGARFQFSADVPHIGDV